MNFYRIDKLGIPHLSSGLDKLDWTEVEKIIHKTFRDSKLDLIVFTMTTPLEGTTTGDQTTPVDLEKTQTTDTGVNQLGTQAISSSPFPLTGSPSRCMEDVESF